MVGLAILAAVLLAGGAVYADSRGTQASDLKTLSRPERVTKCRQIIADNIDSDFSDDCAWLMADMENGISLGMLSPVFLATNSFFNRHAGTGRGYWTGKTYNAGPKDPDLRIYTGLEQSCQDFMQLMGDPRYAAAREAASRNDIQAFVNAVAAAGYSAQPYYLFALNSRARSLGLLV